MNKNTKARTRAARKEGNYFKGQPCYTFFDGKEKHNPANKRNRAANYPKRGSGKSFKS
jgi:hypothetical protein